MGQKKEQTTPERIVGFFKELYDMKFGGKLKGKFVVSRVSVKRFSGEGFLRQALIEQVIDEAMRQELLVAPFGESFLVVSEPLAANYRKVPKRLVTELVEEDGENAGDGEEQNQASRVIDPARRNPCNST